MLHLQRKESKFMVAIKKEKSHYRRFASYLDKAQMILFISFSSEPAQYQLLQNKLSFGCKLNKLTVYHNAELHNYIRVPKNSRILIPSGIKVNVPKGYALIAFNKSGIATKKGLIVGACVVDNGYQGEVHISLINTTNNDVCIFQNQKIVQFILMPVANQKIDEVTLDQLYQNESHRGQGGFGSTNV